MTATPGSADAPPVTLRAVGGGGTSSRVLELPDVSRVADLSDTTLVSVQKQLARIRRQLDAATVAVTAEIVRRSDRALGQNGLAARLGAASVEQAIQGLSGTSRAEARAIAAVASAITAQTPWLDAVTESVGEGDLSVAAAAAIASGLGSPTADVSADDLGDAARDLTERAVAGASPEAIGRTARQVREQLESHRISDLEEHRRSRRSLTWHVLPDGMTKLTALLDPESAAIVTGAIDTVLSPRRGGPRFVDAESAARSADLSADERTSDQLAVDTLIDIVQLAVRAAGSELDPETIFGTQSPAVRVHVTVDTLVTGDGVAWIEGQSALVGADTAARHVCTSGILPVLFAGTASIDTGRTHRLHTPRQRVALAAHWGGCAWPECTRPPSMTEVHHMQAWNGCNTTLANGIPLCRFHHLQLHNSGWRIEFAPEGPERGPLLIPPPGHPLARKPIRLRPKHPLRHVRRGHR